RTQALYDASRAIVSPQQVEDVLQAFVDSAALALGADFVRVNIVDMEKRQLRYVVWDAINPKLGTPEGQTFADLWEGLAGWVLRTGKPVLSPPGVADPRESPAVRQRRLAFTGPLGGCVLVVPMRYRGRLLGTVTAINRDGNPTFGAEDMDMLMALANQAGVMLENVRLRAETEARAADLAVQAQALARSNADLEQFAYVASHDLQEPLRVVSSFLQLFMRRYGDQVPEEGLFFLEQAVDGAQRMQQLIQDLLAYSRVQTRAQERRPVPSGEVLAYTLLGLEHAIAEAGAEISYDALPVVYVDETQFGQLLQNLLSNALKFRGETPARIHIRAQALEEEDMWLFSVQDNGIGIPKEHQKRIFQMFQRLHTREEYPGTGLGLALCKKIVERHGGQIWVESEPGQ
ncbi:MAG: GAF domain-containing protein, partial [Caldilineae bacterium]